MLSSNLVWADHANTISGQYSGTGALKTDFTRTGKRSIIGVAQDFMNSVKRYVKNHVTMNLYSIWMASDRTHLICFSASNSQKAMWTIDYPAELYS